MSLSRCGALLLLALAIAVCLLLPVQGAAGGAGRVVELDDGNFSDVLAGREAVVMFMAPWCGACLQFKPVFAQWASRLSEDAHTQHVLVGRVDCTLNPQVATDLRVQAFPTLMFLRDGKAVAEFTSERTQAELTRWLKKLTTAKVVAPDGAPAAHSPSPSPAAPTTQATAQPARQTQAQSQAAAAQSSDQQQGSSKAGLLDLSEAEVKRLLARLLDLPLALFANHPYMVMSCCWVAGLFSGLFIGLLFVVREKR